MNSGYDKSDLANWAGAGGGAVDPNQQNGQPGDGTEHGEPDGDEMEDEDEGGGASDCCEILKDLSGGLDNSLKELKGHTLPDETPKAFKKKYEKLQDAIEDLKEQVDELVDEHEEEHEELEDDEDEDDEESEDEESDGGDDDDDEESDDESDE